MKWEFHRTTWENSIRTNYMLAAACVGMVLISLLSVYTALTAHERIVVVPAGMTQQATIDWTSADATYLKSFGLFIATLIGNITPSNVHFVVDSLSSYMSPAIYSEVRKKMLSMADSAQFRDSAFATRFVPASVIYEPDTHKVFVQGQMIVSTAITKQTDELVYEMMLTIRNGQPIVDSIESYDGSQSHTQAWIQQQKDLGKKDIPGDKQ